MCWILFICKGPTSFIESINQSGSPKKNICWYGTQKLPKIKTFMFITAKQIQLFFWLQSMKKQLWLAVILIFFEIFPSFWAFGQQYYKNESIHLNSWHHNHKKQKDSLETQVVSVDIFAWIWNIWGSRIKKSQKANNGGFFRNCLVKMTLRLL